MKKKKKKLNNNAMSVCSFQKGFSKRIHEKKPHKNQMKNKLYLSVQITER